MMLYPEQLCVQRAKKIEEFYVYEKCWNQPLALYTQYNIWKISF